jgi:hypothetical protein
MGKSVSNSSAIFDEMLDTVASIGVENTIKALKDARSKSLSLENMNAELILNLVVQETGVSKERILHGNDKSDERKIAVALSVFFIKEELKCSYRDMKKVFGKDEASMLRYKKLLDTLPAKPKTDFDKKLNGHYKNIMLIIQREKTK